MEGTRKAWPWGRRMKTNGTFHGLMPLPPSLLRPALTDAAAALAGRGGTAAAAAAARRAAASARGGAGDQGAAAGGLRVLCVSSCPLTGGTVGLCV